MKTKVTNLKITSNNASKGKTVSMSLSDYYELTRGMKLNFLDETNKHPEEQAKVKQKIKE